MANLIQNPYPQFTDQNGAPLEDGYVFIGVAGFSPLTQPQQAYWDSGLTIPANNIRTRGGYPALNGTPGRLYVDGNYSILVKDKKGQTLYTNLNMVDYTDKAFGGYVQYVNTLDDLRDYPEPGAFTQVSVGGNETIGDGQVGLMYYWDSTSTELDNGMSVIIPNGSTGAGRWIWINTNPPREVVDIDASGTLDLGWRNRVFLCDTTAGTIDLTIPDGDFDAQEIVITNIGTGTLTVTGTGLVSGSNVNFSVSALWSGDEWSLATRSSGTEAASPKGYSAVTISEYDTEAAPDVKAGSVFDNNGATITVATDTTPTGYSGISVSTTFYLYYDESASAFIYSSTAPTWSDSLQGWYNGTDRALFSMYKDSGGTLYQEKKALQNKSDSLNFAVDNISEKTRGAGVNLVGTGNKHDGHSFDIDPTIHFFSSVATLDTVFTTLSVYVPNVGDKRKISGLYWGDENTGSPQYASQHNFIYLRRSSATQIGLFGGRLLLNLTTPSSPSLSNKFSEFFASQGNSTPISSTLAPNASMYIIL